MKYSQPVLYKILLFVRWLRARRRKWEGRQATAELSKAASESHPSAAPPTTPPTLQLPVLQVSPPVECVPGVLNSLHSGVLFSCCLLFLLILCCLLILPLISSSGHGHDGGTLHSTKPASGLRSFWRLYSTRQMIL